MNKLKESILNKAANSGSRDTSNESNNATNTRTSATTSVTDAITRSSDTYIYGVGIVVNFSPHNEISSQTTNKE